LAGRMRQQMSILQNVGVALRVFCIGTLPGIVS
jgi:hypothetical protein